MSEYVLSWESATTKSEGSLKPVCEPSTPVESAVSQARHHAQNLSHAGARNFKLICPDGREEPIHMP